MTNLLLKLILIAAAIQLGKSPKSADKAEKFSFQNLNFIFQIFSAAGGSVKALVCPKSEITSFLVVELR
jgi:hypothetical protein